MSRVLARTSMISDDKMLNTATRMISDRITNIATRSTYSASNRPAVHRPPVGDHRLARDARGERREDLADPVGVDGLDLDHADRVAEHQQGLRVLDRHDHERLVIIVDADLEDRADIVGDDARHRAERRRAALRADQADLAADASRRALRRAATPIADIVRSRAQRFERAGDDLALQRRVVEDVLDAACRAAARLRPGRRSSPSSGCSISGTAAVTPGVARALRDDVAPVRASARHSPGRPRGR